MYGRYLVVFLIAGVTTFRTWADPAPILLSCHGKTKTDAAVVTNLCDALAAELQERVPKRVVLRNVPSDPVPRNAWDVVLEVTRTENYHWEGRLTWGMTGRKSGRGRTTGPPVEIFGMDAPLSPGAYSHFIRSLLKVSKPGFLASPGKVNGPL